MENLELGLNLGSSDLLFPDEVFNVPLDLQHGDQQQQQEFRDDLKTFTALVEAGEVGEEQQDLLQSVIEEIKMAPMEVNVEEGKK